VPERLRKRALRMLWRSNPVLANVDNLVDYGEDFAAEGVLGEVIQTIYQVGKGILLEPEETVPEPEEPMLAAEPVLDAEPVAVIQPPAPEVPLETIENTENTEFRVKRRMHFAFANEELT